MNRRTVALTLMTFTTPVGIALSLPFVMGCYPPYFLGSSSQAPAKPPRTVSSDNTEVSDRGDAVNKKQYSDGVIEYRINGVLYANQAEGARAYADALSYQQTRAKNWIENQSRMRAPAELAPPRELPSPPSVITLPPPVPPVTPPVYQPPSHPQPYQPPSPPSPPPYHHF